MDSAVGFDAASLGAAALPEVGEQSLEAVAQTSVASSIAAAVMRRSHRIADFFESSSTALDVLAAIADGTNAFFKHHPELDGGDVEMEASSFLALADGCGRIVITLRPR